MSDKSPSTSGSSTPQLVDEEGVPIYADGPKADWSGQPPPPTAPPGEVVVEVEDHLKPVVDLLRRSAQSEGMVARECVKVCFDIVQRQVISNMVGNDSFTEGGAGMAHPGAIMSMAATLATEMYRQILLDLNGAGRKEYLEAQDKSKAIRDAKKSANQ